MRRSFEEVLNSTINNSKSKEAHTFPRAHRFQQRLTPPCLRASYDLTGLMMSSQIKRKERTTSQSTRSLKYVSISPGPALYNKPSFIEEKHHSKQGPTFSQAERLDPKPREGVPGPGTYSPKLLKANEPHYSIGERHPHHLSRSAVGPGHYLTEKYNTIEESNSRIYSKYTRPQGCKIPQEERFHSTTKFTTPAPNQYASRTDRMNHSYVFGRERRGWAMKEATPGPGQYLQFSEFAERRRQLQNNLQRMEKLVKEK